MRFTRFCTYVFTVALMASNAAADGKVSIEDEIAGHIKALKKACSAKDTDAITDAMTSLSIRYDDIVDDKLKEKVRAAIGRVCRYKDRDVQHMAIDTFTRMGDPAACKYLLPFIKQSNAKKEPPLFDPAMRAIETLKPDSAVPALLSLTKKSKNLGVASRAMEVLGAYRDASNKAKSKILDSIIGTVRKETPGVKGRERPLGTHTGARARTRWEALAGPMVKTANSLTGQEISSASDWFRFYSANKRKPEVLFQDV